jgi:DNA-binding CsgD family transcriptional regulator
MMGETALGRDLDHLVFDTIERAHLVTSVEELNALFEPVCRKLGFSHFASFSVLDPAGRTVGSYEAGISAPVWRDHYLQQHHFARDAIVRLMPHTLDPIVWSELPAHEDLSGEERLVLNEAREFGHADGYVLPQHFVDGAIASTILLSPDPIAPDPRARAATHVLSSYFAMSVRSLLAPATQLPRIRLSKRQRECLQWVRAGKSDWAIGEILKISEHTVKDHIEKAREKLGVKTRTQAVLAAVRQKLIHL